MNRTEREAARRRKQQRQIIGVAVAAVIFGLVFCGVVMVSVGNWLSSRFDTPVTDTTEASLVWQETSADLTIATSPLMAPVLETLADDFNRESHRTPDGETMQVHITALEPAKMVRAALERPNFQAISPDSSLWIDRLESSWQAQQAETAQESIVPVGQQRTSGQTRYAVSPVVIVAWESVARDLGWPTQAVGWQTIQQKATADPTFKWNHASTDTASGLLATLAEFYAGAGLTRGLTEEAATAQQTLDYVR
ncbi:MAG: substrate-binding domain-containing protein, partial [Caldilineaceae bacterium]|nr:substrate-binding domain-containing protein [Caldilineaceae bacterium]